jgi:hypothetical protein
MITRFKKVLTWLFYISRTTVPARRSHWCRLQYSHRTGVLWGPRRSSYYSWYWLWTLILCYLGTQLPISSSFPIRGQKNSSRYCSKLDKSGQERTFNLITKRISILRWRRDLKSISPERMGNSPSQVRQVTPFSMVIQQISAQTW